MLTRPLTNGTRWFLLASLCLLMDRTAIPADTPLIDDCRYPTDAAAQAETIDQIEAERRLSGQVRFALQVPDVKAAMERLLSHGATLIHPPILTPWGDTNVRFQDPDGMQITLFQPANNEGDGN